MLSGNSEAGMLLCIPLISGDGTVMGICGFEFSTMLFKQSYSPDNTTYTRVFSALAPIEGGYYHMEQGLLAGNTYLNSALAGGIAHIDEKGEFLHLYHTEGDTAAYNGLHRAVSLYPSDSPYRDSVWLAAVMAPHEEIADISREGAWRLRLALSGLALFSLLAAAYISRRYISPVLKTLEGIKAGGYASLPKTQYAEINDLLEFLAAQDEATAAAIAEAEAKAAHADAVQVRRRVPQDIDPESYHYFLDRLETLTKAERRVFDLYVQDKKAQEIAELLNLSINTVKFHNGNIYSKLEVGSRKELLAYIRYMRSKQQEKEGDYG